MGVQVNSRGRNGCGYPQEMKSSPPDGSCLGMAPFFPLSYSKTYAMPNSQNKSDKKNGIVQPKRKATKANPANPGSGQSEQNEGSAPKGSWGSSSGRSSNGGRNAPGSPGEE